MARMGTAATAAANNFVLARGEWGYTDDNVLKIGDGVTAWNSLPAIGGSGGAGLTQEQVEDFVGAMVTGNTETGIAVTYDDAGGKLNFVVANQPLVIPSFSYAGTVAVLNPGTQRWYNDTGRTLTVSKVRASVGTAPTGASLVVDVRKNGTTMFTGTTDRPTIAASGFTDTGIPAVTSIADGDYLTVDVVSVGSTVAGADLTVQIAAT